MASIAQPTEEKCQDTYLIPVCNEGNKFLINGVEINEDAFTSPGNQVTFTIVQLDVLDPPENQGSCPSDINPNGTEWFQLFWDFGDGQFACALDDSPEELMSSEEPYTITHIYPQTETTYHPRLIVTKRYPDEDPPENTTGILSKVWNPIEEELPSITISQLNETNDPDDLGMDCIKITPIHNAHFDEDVWVLLSFMYDGSAQSIEFHYDQELFPSQSSMLYLPGNEPDFMTFSNDGEGLELNLPAGISSPVNPPIVHHIAIQLHTRDQEEEGDEEVTYDLFARISPGPIQTPPGTPPVTPPCTSLTDTISGKSVGPKDPNEKTVDITLTNSPVPETLTYTISFYNLGKGLTDSVKIKDVISDKLDLCSVDMKKVVINGVSISPNNAAYDDSFEPDIKDDTLIWKIGQSLMGLWQEGAGYDFPIPAQAPQDCELSEITNTTNPEDVSQCDPRTRMELVFSIKTNCSFGYGDTIENEANIQFDNLAWFTTSPAKTAKVCCDTSMNHTIMEGKPGQILNLYKGTLIPSSITAIFDSGIPSFNPVTGIFEYPNSLDSLDRVVFTVCDSSGNCDTTETFLCVYAAALPLQFPVCSRIPCEDTPCPPEEDPPLPPPSPISWPVIVGILIALIALIVLLINRRRSA